MILGITQRIYHYAPYGEYWECLDSRLYGFLKDCGFISVGISHTQDPESIASFCDGIVLSGGNDIGEFSRRDKFEYALIESALKQGKKILGICRGMQVIVTYFGIALKDSNHPIKCTHKLNGVFTHNVTSFHRYGIFDLPQGFRLLASVKDEIEAFSNEQILALMWHPERESNQETRIIDKHIITEFFKEQ